jgi:primosomal protein N' (replication factor Y)
VLGSATPSLESWHGAQSGRYRLLELHERAVKDAVLPVVKIINLEREKPSEGLTPRLIAAIRQRLEKGEQSLLFLNRRGYAPVLACDACGWISNCTRCTANLVLHKGDHRLRCHHCGLEQRIPVLARRAAILIYNRWVAARKGWKKRWQVFSRRRGYFASMLIRLV